MDGLMVLLLIAAFVMAWMALSRISALSAKVTQLTARLAALETDMSRQPADIAEIAVSEPVPEPEEVGAAIEAELAATDAPVGELPTPETAPEPAMAAVQAPDMEQRLATRWFVWIGGLAMAFGGLLFVKYAYDIGLISPTLQIVLGLLLGGAIIGAGQYVKPKAELDYVPQALTAAGLAITFGSIYAAYALYELIPPATAFAGLGLIGVFALLLSLRQGPFVAALGVAGSYLTPTLITSPNPSAWSFFPYLLIIQATCFAILRKRPWWWLGYASIAGSIAWALLWFAGPFVAEHALPLGLFALASAAVAVFAIDGRQILSEESGSLHGIASMSGRLKLGSTGILAGIIILSALVVVAQHSLASLVMFATGIAAVVSFAWMKKGESYAALPAAAVTLLVLLRWREASFVDLAMGDDGLWANILGSAAKSYARWMLGAGAAFFATGLAGLMRKKPAWSWAALAGGSSAAFLFFAWARVDAVIGTRGWAAIAAFAALVLAGAVWRREQRHDDVDQNLASGLLAIAAACVAIFTLDRLLDGVWFTLAVALLASGFAAWTLRSTVRLLAPVSTALASMTALRLFLSREFWVPETALPLGLHWPLYGYGVPAALFLGASRWIRKTGHDRYAAALEGISLGLVISLVSLEIRALIAGNYVNEGPQLVEVAAHVMAWLGAAYGLMYRQALFSNFISKWGARILIVVSVSTVALTSLIVLNPIVSGEPVLGNVAFNELLLAYAAPAVLLALIAQKLTVLNWEKLRPALGAFTLLLALTYVTLETKRVFQGRLMEAQSLTNAEGYAYSAVWLIFSLLLFITGLKMQRQYLRYGGLAVMILVVGKVFLLDVAGLGGFYRIASVFGMGVCLLAIGWLYQRFMQRPAAPAGTAGAEEAATSQ
jgi:uncharacterized membrane protein